MADPIIRLSGHVMPEPTGCTAATRWQHRKPGIVYSGSYLPETSYQNEPHDPDEREARRERLRQELALAGTEALVAAGPGAVLVDDQTGRVVGRMRAPEFA